MKTAAPKLEAFRRLFGEGRYGQAVSAALGRTGASSHAPVDFYDAFFPADDGRQDLVNWLTVRPRLLAPHRGTFTQMRCSLEALPGAQQGEVLGLLAYCDLFLGEYDRAAESMERALKTAPPSFGLHFLHATSLWIKAAKDRSRELMPRALGSINAALACDGENVYAYYVRVGLRRELEDVAGRLADAETMIRLRPDFVFASIEIAETLGETKHYRKALAEYNRLLTRYPKEAWSWAQRGRLRGLYGYYKLALEDFAQALSLDPACGPVHSWRGEARRRIGDYDGAFEDFDAAICLEPEHRLAHQWRGRLRLILGSHEEAVADLTRALELEPREQLAAAWRAEACWKLGRCEEAARAFDALHPAEPKKAWNRRVAAGDVLEIGYHLRAAQAQQRRERAFWSDLDAGVARANNDAWALAFRGRCRVADGLLREALVDLSLALRLDGAHAYALRWRGECLRRMGAPVKAKADLDAALRLDPLDRWASGYRALACVALGDEAGAQADFERATAPRDQRFSVVHLWHGEWLASLGRKDEARRAIEEAFILDGKDPRVLEWRERLGASV